MQIVIKLAEEDYNDITLTGENTINLGVLLALRKAVRNGTPLPEHHGRLGDLDDLEAEMINGIKAGNYEEGYEKYQNINNIDDCVECVHFADTIIEGSENE